MCCAGHLSSTTGTSEKMMNTWYLDILIGVNNMYYCHFSVIHYFQTINMVYGTGKHVSEGMLVGLWNQ